MAFRISYLKDGGEIAATSWPGTLENSIVVATKGLTRYAAESATIINETGTVVWSSLKS